MNQMTLINPRHAFVRDEDFGREKTYHKPMRYFTLKERVDNAHTENALIQEAAWLKSLPASFDDEADRSKPSNDDRARTVRFQVLDAMDGAMTARQIAEATGKTAASLPNLLRRMEETGAVEFIPMAKNGKGQKVAGLWRKLPDAYTKAAMTLGEQTRQKVLAALDTPAAPFELAEKLDMHGKSANRVFKELAARGLIVEAGMTYNSRGMPVQAWVRA